MITAKQAQEGNAASSLAHSASLDPVPVEQLTGQWEGVYFVYPQPMGIKVQLRSIGGNAVAGELSFYPLNTNQRNILETIRGKYVLKGKYDPLTQTFELSPGHRIERPNRLVFATTLRGVLSVQRQEIAGFLVSRISQSFPAKMHFVMSRPQYPMICAIELTTMKLSELKQPLTINGREGKRVGYYCRKCHKAIPVKEAEISWTFLSTFPSGTHKSCGGTIKSIWVK